MQHDRDIRCRDPESRTEQPFSSGARRLVARWSPRLVWLDNGRSVDRARPVVSKGKSARAPVGARTTTVWRTSSDGKSSQAAQRSGKSVSERTPEPGGRQQYGNEGRYDDSGGYEMCFRSPTHDGGMQNPATRKECDKRIRVGAGVRGSGGKRIKEKENDGLRGDE